MSGPQPPSRGLTRSRSIPSNADERANAAASILLTERMDTFDRSGSIEGKYLPNTIPVGAVEDEDSSTDLVPSRQQSFTSRPGDTHFPTFGAPHPREGATEDSLSRREDADSDTDSMRRAVRLIKRSSLLNRAGTSDGSRASRIYPVSSPSDGANSGNQEIAQLNGTSIDNREQRVLNKGLSLHKVVIASRNNSGAVGGIGSLQAPDPSIHRMIYFRTKKELDELFDLPSVSLWGRRFNRVVFVIIMLSIADLAVETCDGPNWGSTDPGYPYLPGQNTHDVVDGIITMLFTMEFLGRIIVTRSARAVVRDPLMWLDLIGLSPWYIIRLWDAIGETLGWGNVSEAELLVNLLRLNRIVRLALILRHYEQSKIMYLAIKASLRPLSITLFFLFTLVLVIATAIFYAEPCYNVETCTFTDIFNSAYFVMVTVATVGYGNQVPSLKNPWSVMLTMIAMILGQIYFSMPVAIIGNNFQQTYENFQMDKKKKARYLDASLSPFDCQALHNHAKRLCDIQYHFLKAWSVVHPNISAMTRVSTRSSQTWTASQLDNEAERYIKTKEVIKRLLDLHDEAALLLQVFIPHRRRSYRMALDSQSQGVLSNIYSKAKKAMSKAKVRSGHHSIVVDPRVASQTLRGRVWLVLEVPDSSRLATIVNQGMVALALISIMLFFFESLQELAASGVETNGCRSVVKSYCHSTGFYETGWRSRDPACFVRLSDGTSDFSQRLDFSCSTPAQSTVCYGNGLNFGSLAPSALDCQEAFLQNGASLVCYRQQCRASLNMIFDMGPYWIYFEWLFGTVFSVELALRFYISQDRKHFWRDVYVVFDGLAILPFFVEVVELLFAHVRPEYAIVSTAPSFLSVIRVLKITRILKLTRHFRGTKVLASTAKKVWKPLIIPLFFLFTGCIIAGAMFYEVERGTECFVGEVCMWWHKNVLTPQLAAGLPLGKRILLQDKVPVTITDMIHSTWLSYTTLTSVGYGDLVARTSIGKFFCIFVIITATTYSAMPVSLVGTQFYSLYEKHMEKMVVKQGGSSLSWRTRSRLTIVLQPKTPASQPKKMTARKPETYMLSDDELLVAHEFESMKLTIQNVLRSLEAASLASAESFHRKGSVAIKAMKPSATSRRSVTTSGLRGFEGLDRSIEQKSFAIMDTLLQFSQVIERLQDSPLDFEAFENVEDDLHAALYPSGYVPQVPCAMSPRPKDIDC